MKKSLRLISLLLACLSLCFVLVSCQPALNGTYEAGVSAGGLDLISGTLTFTKDGDVKYTTSSVIGSKTYVGEYEINEKLGTIELDFEDDGCVLEGSHEFKEDKDAGTITIGKTTYTKK
jgi:hypothetical protein